jgi:hypothetical protein
VSGGAAGGPVMFQLAAPAAGHAGGTAAVRHRVRAGVLGNESK